MSWLDHHFILYRVDEFFLMEIDDNFVTIGQFIEESKDIIVVSFCPRVVGTMTKDKTISLFPWIG